MFYFYVFFFFKQKTAYEMRISDWSSDVCSSDLRRVAGDPRGDPRRARLSIPQAELGEVDARALLDRLDEILARRRLAVVALEIEVGAFAEPQIGRASCRERVCQYV